jgi:hypothetical protein
MTTRAPLSQVLQDPGLTNPTEGETLFIVADSGVEQKLTVSRARLLLDTVGPAGPQGIQGSQGVQGAQGVQGLRGQIGDKYATSSSDSISIPTSHPTTNITITVESGLAYEKKYCFFNSSKRK